MVENMSRLTAAYDREKLHMMNIIHHQNKLLNRYEHADGEAARNLRLVNGSYTDALHMHNLRDRYSTSTQRRY